MSIHIIVGLQRLSAGTVEATGAVQHAGHPRLRRLDLP
jgi:hypothetical protein